MKMKTKALFLTAGLLSVLISFPVFAGTWEQQESSWKYINDDGTYATGWINDNGKDYYLDANGNMLADTVTPDGYYVDGSGAWNGQPAGQGDTSQANAAQTPQAPQTPQAAGLSTATSVPATVFQPGKYQVGVGIPAGDYVVMTIPGAFLPYYEIRSNGDFDSYEGIIDNCLFDYNAILRLEDGQFLYLDDCTASPIGEMPQIDYRVGTMFQVGYHIPAGTYRLKSTEQDGGFYAILSYPSDNLDSILDCSTFTGEREVTVSDGQYLQLSFCNIVQ